MRETHFFYDLNSNLIKRELPNGVSEHRNFDALNRLTSNTNASATSVFSVVNYVYDAVGNLQEMSDSVTGLHTIPASNVWNWEYDDAYRLLSESVDDASSFVKRTEFDWDAAGNRSKVRKYAGESLSSTTTYKKSSPLNQMLGWTSGETNAVYVYDANGNRTGKFIHGGSGSIPTDYTYDEDNRLIEVTLRDTEEPKIYSFAYDYRTRRISRITPTESTTHVFDGGLSVQEYSVPPASSGLSIENLTTESVRTEGYGGGVGGMVYSVRNGQLEASHSNHRGDVVARTDNQGNISWFARYNAYGTRFDEVGSTYDRQRGNTKDEESPLGLNNQNKRYLDIEHGVWLTLDPIGYGDGPNLYLYVRNNPIIQFDPLGLETVRAKFQRANVMPLYHAWNFLSLGTLGKNDRLVERMESGEISVGQWQAGSVGNGGVALASVAAGGGAASLAKTAVVKGAAAGFAAASVDHLGTEAVAGAADYDSEQGSGALKAAAGTATGAAVGFAAGKLSQTSNPKTETVQRWMSKAELKATKETGLFRGGRGGKHYATDSANKSATRARQRSALEQTPEVRVTLEVPAGKFSKPSTVKPKYKMPGGGSERTARGKVPAKVIKADGDK